MIIVNWFGNLRIGTKLAVGFIGAMTVSLVFAVFVFNMMAEFREDVGDLAGLHRRVEIAKDLQLQVANLWQFMTDASLTREQQAIDVEAKDALNAAIADMDSLIAAEQGISSDRLTRLQKVKGNIPEMFAVGVRMAAAYRRDWKQGNVVMEEFDRTAGTIITDVGEIAKDVQTSFAASAAEINTMTAESRSNAIIMVVLMVTIAGAIGVMIAKQTRKPLLEVIARVDKSDLTTTFDSGRKDEVGMLQRSLDRFIGSIRATLIGASETSNAVASASNQISQSTEQMARGAREQAAQTTEIASAIEEMTQTIVENSRNAERTAATAQEARQAAVQGGGVVEETIAGMKRIADVVRTSADTVRTLGVSGEKIGEIISVIDDIADQTNLLALNAAIEAARAGEQGRGFAVVADEVRKLADRTSKATREITSMIRTLQADTSGAASSMEQGTREVDNGIALADRAGKSLSGIVATIQRLTDMVGQIAVASQQQSSASEQISRNIESISSVTRESETSTGQIAQAANDLSRLTEGLHGEIGKFRLSRDASTGVGHRPSGTDHPTGQIRPVATRSTAPTEEPAYQ